MTAQAAATSAPSATPKRRELKPVGYELFIGALSVLSIFNLILLLVLQTDQSLRYVVGIINAIVFPIFLFDFFYRLFTTESKSTYFFRKFGWADLLSSLPFPNVKIFRIFRLWRVLRLIMEFGAKNLWREFITHRAENALYTVFFLVLCVLEFGSLAVLAAESGVARRQHHHSLRRHLVGLRDDHHSGLRRPVSRV